MDKHRIIEILMIYMTAIFLFYTNLVVMTAQPKLPTVVQCPTCGTTHEITEEWTVIKGSYTNHLYCEVCDTHWIIKSN